MDEHEQVEQAPEGYSGEVKFEIQHDHLLDGMLQGDGLIEIKTVEVDAEQVPLGKVVQLPLNSLVNAPVTALDHPPGRAVRQASLAAKTSWKAGHHKGSQAQRLYYVADNGIEISLGTPENPLDLEEAKKQIKKAGELTVLIDRLLFWYWLTRSRPRPGDGKVFVAKNGSVPVSIEELLTMLGYKKHLKRERPLEGQQYTDGFRTEDKDRLAWNITLLAAFQVQSSFAGDDPPIPLDIHGAYLRYSLAYWDGVHVGYLISPGDWINTVHLPDIPALMRIDEQIFQFDRQEQQHEIRLCLYLAEAFRDQLKEGTLGQPLMVPVENHPGKFRYITMEELLNEAKIKIDRNNLTQRFAPRIEDALQVLIRKNILARAEPVTPPDKQKGYWGKAWCAMPMIIQAPLSLVEEYRLLQPQTPMLPAKASSRGRRRKKE